MNSDLDPSLLAALEASRPPEDPELTPLPPTARVEVQRGDAPRHRYPVGSSWAVVARGVDGRYYSVVTDPQDDFEHALHLAEAYTTPGEDYPDFVPDVRIVRDGAVVMLLEAVEAVLEWADNTGATGDVIDIARDALDAAINPRIDIGGTDQVDRIEGIRKVSLEGTEAQRAGNPRTANPYPEGSLEWTCWDRGWEWEAIRIHTPDQGEYLCDSSSP